MPVRCGRGSTVAVEHATAMQARRVGSRIDAGTTTIREEGESGYFLFLFSCGRSVAYCTVWAGVKTHQRASRRNGSPIINIFRFFCFCCILACKVK
jgi:hypothetical protein